MKLTLHKANSRGAAEHGWLSSRHTFSFAHYYDSERMGFGTLRVINDDIIAPSMGFGTHPHQNMEIISVPISGALRHKDTMGNEYVVRTGEIQAMSAGTGVRHSEYNASSTEMANFLQIWVLPKKPNIDPAYSHKKFSVDDRVNQFQLIVSPDGREDSVQINQDAYFSLLDLDEKGEVTYKKYHKENGIYLFLIEGNLEINGESMGSRDGLGIEKVDDLSLRANSHSKLLIMEVPMA